MLKITFSETVESFKQFCVSETQFANIRKSNTASNNATSLYGHV